LVSPSTTTLYDVHASMRDVLYIAVSQSGSSPDLIESLDRARASGATTLAVTNAPDSDLARQSEFSVYVHAGTERSVAATKSYTAQLLSLFVLVEAIAGRQGREASGLADLAAEILAQEARIKDICCRYRFAEQIVVASRGYNYPTARESALKLMETSYLVAHAFSGADLLHGPMAMIQKGFPVIAIIPPGHGGTALMPVMQRLRAQRADVLVVGSAEHSGAGTSWLHVVDQLPEVVSPLLLILPMQLFAWHLARARGIDPDVPAGLEKVTRTR
ncbi:MAG: SIS domain-containing protein, partial [Chloroflexota bacterium]